MPPPPRRADRQAATVERRHRVAGRLPPTGRARRVPRSREGRRWRRPGVGQSPDRSYWSICRPWRSRIGRDVEAAHLAGRSPPEPDRRCEPSTTMPLTPSFSVVPKVLVNNALGLPCRVGGVGRQIGVPAAAGIRADRRRADRLGAAGRPAGRRPSVEGHGLGLVVLHGPAADGPHLVALGVEQGGEAVGLVGVVGRVHRAVLGDAVERPLMAPAIATLPSAETASDRPLASPAAPRVRE
jgi:hypothetical protein